MYALQSVLTKTYRIFQLIVFQISIYLVVSIPTCSIIVLQANNIHIYAHLC